MKWAGFMGPAYQSRSRTVADERLVNLFPEAVGQETPNAKQQFCLYSSPGTAVFCTLPQSPIRGLLAANGRVFAVAGLKLYEIHSGGTYTERATLTTTGRVRMAYIGDQVFIASEGQGFVFNTGTNQLTQASGFPSDTCTGLAMVDNYFIASAAGSRSVAISNLNNGLIWSASDIKVKEGWGDNVVTVFADHRELWVFGSETTEVWYNSGNADFPFDRIQGAFIEAGCDAAESPAKLDNSIVWLGRDARGQRIVWRANGYTPQRVSNHAIEAEMQRYARTDDAIGFTYQEQGHLFYVLTFPTANKTWVLDAATNSWHEREWWDSRNARANAIRGRLYAFGHGHHLLGDWETGKIYRQSMDLADDAGEPLRRIRRAPGPDTADEMAVYDRVSLVVETGTQFNSTGLLATLRASNDGGYTWSSESEASLDVQGNYGQRVQWRRLGAARRRVFEIQMTDSAPFTVADALIEVRRNA